jgi:hypothetical protein
MLDARKRRVAVTVNTGWPGMDVPGKYETRHVDAIGVGHCEHPTQPRWPSNKRNRLTRRRLKVHPNATGGECAGHVDSAACTPNGWSNQMKATKDEVDVALAAFDPNRQKSYAPSVRDRMESAINAVLALRAPAQDQPAEHLLSDMPRAELEALVLSLARRVSRGSGMEDVVIASAMAY